MAPSTHRKILASLDGISIVPMGLFPLFPMLPSELRVQIWKFALKRQRIIKVYLQSNKRIDVLISRQMESRPPTHSDERYGVVVNGYQTISKLFHVCRESRGVAMQFYRVHLPCWLTKCAIKDKRIHPGLVYFNPEYDFLYIDNRSANVVDFLHDLKTIHDPRNIGLRNLAIDLKGKDTKWYRSGQDHFIDFEATGCGKAGLFQITLSTLSPPLRASMTEILTQLHEVFFVDVLRHRQPDPSYPIDTMSPNFDRLQLEPRQIRDNLSKMFIRTDPRHLLQAWQNLLWRNFERRVMPGIQYRFLLTYSPQDHEIYDRHDAEEWLLKEPETGSQWEDEWSDEWENEKEAEKEADTKETDTKTVEAAFGFWLFPVDAFGPIPEAKLDKDVPQTLDLTKYWPELALARSVSP
ncbi:hypothetical protein F4821DRAFT_274852 [Hypoxylon rubiginosum]|uniref:Uncharacterized protein n=1 Tax=Hypoxylon rubiginosum TaxID=110542 RepID=A0ACC0CMJ8_9PEZI|nr:hypothetical protein F4821DRAFT_274852 [Hypoxylon rubiginosum]